MITKKRVNIPIFNYTIIIVFYDKWSELNGIIEDDLYNEGSSRARRSGSGDDLRP